MSTEEAMDCKEDVASKEMVEQQAGISENGGENAVGGGSGNERNTHPNQTLMVLTADSPKKRSREHEEASAIPMSSVEGVDENDPKAGPVKKKAKLTEEERRREKEVKEREKAEREREKEAKKAERDEKKRIKEEERKKKEDEKKKKEEEKAKKERAQTRLISFFVKPAAPKPPTGTTSSNAAAASAEPTKSEPTEPERQSDYNRTFQPFFVKPNVSLAPLSYFERDAEYKAFITRTLDESLKSAFEFDAMDIESVAPIARVSKEQICELLRIPPCKRKRRGKILGYTTKDLLARINSPDDHSLPPLPGVKGGNSAVYLKLLNALPTKMLCFAEDVRPPYSGTYTRVPTSSSLRRGRNPFKKDLPRVNYDYDSEAEWEDGGLEEDGEELLSDEGEEEEDDNSAGDEEMEGFLDDEEDCGAKRKQVVAALVPLNSGLVWEDAEGRSSRKDFEEMRMEVLLDHIDTPIDPFSTSYWASPSKPPQTSHLLPFPTKVPTSSSIMVPPPRRLPISSLKPEDRSPSAKKSKISSLVPAEDLEEFKRAIDGSDMTKAGLVEVLKKRFPKIGKEAIKNTLGIVAVRVGEREKDKRWVLL